MEEEARRTEEARASAAIEEPESRSHKEKDKASPKKYATMTFTGEEDIEELNSMGNIFNMIFKCDFVDPIDVEKFKQKKIDEAKKGVTPLLEQKMQQD